MRLTRASILAFGLITSLGLVPLACGATNATGGAGGQSSAASGAGGAGQSSGEGGDLFGDAGDQEIVDLSISPADPVVEVLNGMIPAAIPFTATGTTKGGGTVTVSGEWSFDRLDVANINAGSGSFTATGLNGGKGTVTFTMGSLSATTSATVKMHITSDPESVDPSIKIQFGQAGQADPALNLLYPYDKTVFPRGLTGPVIQWNGGAASDVYYVHATSPTFEYEAWGKVPPPSRYPMPDDAWKKLTDSTSGDIAFSVQRHDGSQAYLGAKETWTIAPATLTGTVYFWEVNTGNVVRIKPGDKAPEDFLVKPAGETCVACHSVSKDGSRIAAAFEGGWSPWGTFDAATGASLFNSKTASGFEAISPDGAYVLWRHWVDGNFNSAGYLSLSAYNSTTELAQLNPGGGAPSHPAWSGDGSKIAFSVRTDGNGLDFNTSTLWITTVDTVNATFSGTQKIVPNDAGRPTVTYPTFAPDSKWIAFERSTQARSRGAKSDVWLTSLDGATVIPLDSANRTGILAGPEASSTYEPTFMPVAAGGYFWLIVVSERTYGNTLTNTDPATRNKQLWVTAIDQNPIPGQDPSHQAFWLPGQALDNNNMRGEWALSPCKQIGQSCSAGYDCCAGFCHDDGMGNYTCVPGGGGCSQEGDACKTAADCCDPTAVCTGGFCANGQPH